jgi:multiple sugar transport system ATP-binding protein
MAEVRLDSVSKNFASTAAVAKISLTIADGEFVVLLGPTGAGKTTTLRLIAGLERPDAGRVWIDGRDVTREAAAMRDVAFVFQQYSLYPHLSVFDNLAFPLRSPLHKLPPRQIEAKVRDIARLLRIEDKLPARVTALSGGQMQRVAIGRALVRTPNIFLMDEPLSSLDAKLRADLRVEIKRIQQDVGATILYVTHDQTEAMTLANRVGVLENGRLVQIGSPREIYEAPVNLHVASRLGSPAINFLPRHAIGGLPVPPAVATVGARTEHMLIRRASAGHMMGTVSRVEHLGDQDHLHIRLGKTNLVTLSDPEQGLVSGDHVSIEFIRPLLFDAAGTRIAA